MVAEKRKKESLLPAIITNLGNSKTFLQARQALQSFDEETVIENFTNILSNSDLGRHKRRGIIKALKDYPASNLLLDQLDETDQGIYNETVDSLLVRARAEELDEKELEIISSEIQKVAKNCTRFTFAKNYFQKMIKNFLSLIILTMKYKMLYLRFLSLE